MFTFPVGPFPVTVEVSFLMFAVMLGWDRGGLVELVSWLVVVFVSVLVHELGHATFGRALGARPRIVLRGLGGVTLTPLARRLSWKESIGLSLAGPAAGLLPGIAAVALLLATNPTVGALSAHPGTLFRLLVSGRLQGRTPFEELLFTFVTTSFFWTLLNLLPILPLDGGNVLHAALTAIRKKPSLRPAAILSALLSGALAALVFFRLQGGLFLGIFLAAFALQNLALAREAGKQGPPQPAPAPVDEAARRDAASALEAARAALLRGDEAAAAAVAGALEQAGGEVREAAAHRIRAGLLLAHGEFGPAGLEAGRAFGLYPDPDAAVVAARAALRGGDAETARTWLRRAAEAGASLEAIRRDAELGPLAG